MLFSDIHTTTQRIKKQLKNQNWLNIEFEFVSCHEFEHELLPDVIWSLLFHASLACENMHIKKKYRWKIFVFQLHHGHDIIVWWLEDLKRGALFPYFSKSSTYGHADVIMHFHCCPFVHFSLVMDGKKRYWTAAAAHKCTRESVEDTPRPLSRVPINFAERKVKYVWVFFCAISLISLCRKFAFLFFIMQPQMKKHTSILHNTMRVDGVACSKKEWYRPNKSERERDRRSWKVYTSKWTTFSIRSL